MADGKQDGFHRRIIEARGGTMAVLTAMLGTFRSSIWTIGYLTQAEA